MGDKSSIEWTDATWNPVRGCSRVSEGCRNCYAEIMAARFSKPGQWGHGFAELKGNDHRWTGNLALIYSQLQLPLRWRKPRNIFVNSTSDLFHPALTDDDIAHVFAYIAASYWHTHQVLTKRPQRARSLLRSTAFRQLVEDHLGPIGDEAGELGLYDVHGRLTTDWRAQCPDVLTDEDWPLRSLWLGVSTEDQESANERIPLLLETPAAVRFLSCEPLLGPIDLSEAWHGEDALASECWGECGWCKAGLPPLHNCERGSPSLYAGRDRSGLDWVIVGGESGPGARPMHPEWARALRDQCAAAGVPFFFKQWGEHMVAEGEPIAGADIERFWVNGKEAALVGIDPTIAVHDCAFDTGAAEWMVRVGKQAAGRLLDGREHNEFPR